MIVLSIIWSDGVMIKSNCSIFSYTPLCIKTPVTTVSTASDGIGYYTLQFFIMSLSNPIVFYIQSFISECSSTACKWLQ